MRISPGGATVEQCGGSLRLPAGATAALLQQFDRPGPRYTSYPTAADFGDSFGESAYVARLQEAAAVDEPWSLYLHLPFCEQRCAYCGCMAIATRRRDVVARYLEYLHCEIGLLAGRLGDRRRIVQYHWGGGTPTYLNVRQIAALQAVVCRHFELDRQAESAVEIDPRVTTAPQIDLLRALGFNRLSMGVQDFTPEVQDAIYRHQDEAQTRRLYAYARGSGFGSINIDLVYGLPRQSVETFTRTLESVVEMRPERIAVYSYAHIPSLRPNQARINSDELPSREVKAACFGMAVETFLDAGYVQIGMDHFALPSDDLAVAVRRGTLHRNFMGYTTRQAADLLACGVSAIGEVQGAFAQNTKSLATYYAALDAGRLPIERGYVLDGDDRLRRHVIMQLMCNFRVDRREVERRFDVTFGEYFRLELEELEAEDGPVAQGFLEIRPDRLAVLPDGRFFVRNICMAFDRHLRRRRITDDPPPFSRTV